MRFSPVPLFSQYNGCIDLYVPHIRPNQHGHHMLTHAKFLHATCIFKCPTRHGIKIEMSVEIGVGRCCHIYSTLWFAHYLLLSDVVREDRLNWIGIGLMLHVTHGKFLQTIHIFEYPTGHSIMKCPWK